MGGGAFVVPWKLAAENGDTQIMVLVMLVSSALFNSLLLCRPAAPSLRHTLQGWRLLLGLASCFAVLTLAGNSATAHAISRLSAPMVSVILRSDVLITAALGWLYLGERLRLRFVWGAALAGVGLWIAQSPDPGAVGDAVGVGICLSAAVAFSIMGVMTRRYIHDLDPLALNALRLWLSVGIWFAVNDWPTREQLNTAVVVYASLAAVIGPGLARLALMLSARDLSARWTALLGLTGPMWAVLFSTLWLQQLPTSGEICGGGLLLLGIFFALPSASTRR